MLPNIKPKKRKILYLLPLGLLVFVLLPGGGYTYWNSANPERTCASCHEISPSVAKWKLSAHRELNCTECHGTALSNGFHSLSEKLSMVFIHLDENKENEEIHMNENQVLELSERCTKCHQDEKAKWEEGGHSITYERVFLDTAHNKMETPYWDCLRCHGMFYNGNINDLLEFPENKEKLYELKDKEQAFRPAIPCLACHKVHTENETRKKKPDLQRGAGVVRNPVNSLYIRADKRHIRTDFLLSISMMDHGKRINITLDPAYKLCIQCHSPNHLHQVGSEDDHTPTGVHEGVSCIACHEPHSNNARNSCDKCHPAISNCKLDVKTMNTNYFDRESKNNIHWVKCGDCHEKVMRN